MKKLTEDEAKIRSSAEAVSLNKCPIESEQVPLYVFGCALSAQFVKYLIGLEVAEI